MGKWYGKWLKFKHSMSICFLCEINSTTEIILPSIQAVYHWYGPSIWAFAMKPPGFSPPPTPCVGVLKLVNLSSNGQIRWKVTGFMAMWPVHVYIKMSTCDITINTCVYLDIPHVAHQLIQYRWIWRQPLSLEVKPTHPTLLKKNRFQLYHVYPPKKSVMEHRWW